jgi:hypothetical protein
MDHDQACRAGQDGLEYLQAGMLGHLHTEREPLDVAIPLSAVLR